MGKYNCLCCGYKTIEERAEFEICPVCFWEDDVYIDFSTDPISSAYYDGVPEVETLLDTQSGANHGLTLRQARENYKRFGACEESMVKNIRPPKEDEK